MGIDNTPTPDATANLGELVDAVLDPLREKYGRPIHVSSGYRCPRLNRAVGGSATSQHVKGEAADKVWRELFEYIGENLDKRLTLSELSKKCFYNPSYFSRTFKEKFGITLADYLQSERAEAAARLLKETDLPTQAVAEKCGFSDKSSLYRAFVKIYGVTPSEYRKK